MDIETEDLRAEHLAEAYLRQIRGFSPNAGGCLEAMRAYGAPVVTHAALITLEYQQDMIAQKSVPDCDRYVKRLHREPCVQSLLEHTLNALATDWKIGNVRQQCTAK